ncbi:LpxI family protein [Neptunicoccus sediminis]|uniref:LpxI family protein n=1 Tax=Neptunicoccus sediminis TaxID=1892596 RepID=UPI000845BC84|nr:UDP-2,3-diacylglucosamine diphosphatase LpxI [Neptunicoccus sediminis]
MSAASDLKPLAIVAGDGDLPKLLAEECQRSGRDYVLVLFAGFSPEWTKGLPVIEAEFEKPARMFKALKKRGFDHVTFAGAMQRPQLRPLKFDWKFLRLAPSLLPAMKAGDDVTLRTITAIFQSEGIEVIGAHDVLATLLAPSGVQTVAKLSKADWIDIKRGFDIAEASGRLDVGQGAVVAQGICLAVESIQGTDAMLRFVAETGEAFRLDKKGAKGVLCKLPKPGQDWRTDLPSIGPATMEAAAQAGLAGVAVQAGGVLVLGLEQTIAKADELGLFLVGVGREGAAAGPEGSGS